MVRMVPNMFIMFPVFFLLLFTAIALIVLLIKLCSKKPWMATLAVLGLLLIVGAVFYIVPARRVAHLPHLPEISTELRAPRSQDTTAAIWLPGIEDEFEANVYPSKLSAVRSLGLRIGQAVQRVLDAEASPSRFIVFQGAHDRSLVEAFGEAVTCVFPETQWSIEPETAAVQDDEVGIRLDLMNVQTLPTPWMRNSENTVASGTVQASVMATDKYASIKADFTDKPWVEDFSGFLNVKPNRRFVIAKSTDSCMTESEANRQALENACAQLTEMLSRISRRRSGVPAPLASRVDAEDILEGDLILDRFVQSFEGSAGRIWRQALLIDGSTTKLEQLAHRKVVMARAMKMNWARMFITVFGLLLLITIVYAFLNAATKGYYVWSLRIAGIVLAAVVIFLLLS
jgi:hypothetical protein